MPLPVETRLEIKELELKSLLETIRAINSNAPEKDLYKIFKFIIRSNRNIAKLAMYVYDEVWECKTHFGTETNFPGIPLDSAILDITEAANLPSPIPHFEEFEKIIPVKHKDTVLAYVFISSSEEVEDEDVLDLDFIEALSNIIIVAIENKKLARKELKQKQYRRQLEIAKDVQTLLFPKVLPYDEKLKIEASYLPHHTIGGDYYDYIKIDEDSFLICIADVSGKGVPAAILMSNFQASLRILSTQGLPMETVVEKLNHLIIQNSDGENFITAFFALYNYKTNELTFINAGHNPPFMYVNGKMSRLETGTTILGGFNELPFLEKESRIIKEDFFIFCFTDGFTETYNEADEEFGDAPLEIFLAKSIDTDQKELHVELINELNTYKGENAYADDITLLSCKVSPKA
ncbi:PP2C family protein-serine/threonine phosphatase [Flammeovirgaceae bacterium SG7u.111]|nr:PP2C family protein-serine/threonine phosphatase [Flammeovirgaceae bacterium SG7u.132]WPO34265.1 PP2C family protein-serine/threonine phosphatase [Flammeovirgaceae bacterium SG7u.111]